MLQSRYTLRYNTATSGLSTIPHMSVMPMTPTPVPRLVRTTLLPSKERLHRVAVHVRGDLSCMTRDWTPQEQLAGRRLVRFTWTQVGSTLQIDCDAILQDRYEATQTVISCLKWEDAPPGRGIYFVTLVDVILLLERLVSQKFAVEEKNRIRRNLQGLKPLTVARAKQEYASFFQQIMKYPAPRPRNIEKDVKVFSWSLLNEALGRVLSKYSCDYGSSSVSSSVPELLPVSAPTYTGYLGFSGLSQTQSPTPNHNTTFRALSQTVSQNSTPQLPNLTPPHPPALLPAPLPPPSGGPLYGLSLFSGTSNPQCAAPGGSLSTPLSFSGPLYSWGPGVMYSMYQGGAAMWYPYSFYRDGEREVKDDREL